MTGRKMISVLLRVIIVVIGAAMIVIGHDLGWYVLILGVTSLAMIFIYPLDKHTAKSQTGNVFISREAAKGMALHAFVFLAALQVAYYFIFQKALESVIAYLTWASLGCILFYFYLNGVNRYLGIAARMTLSGMLGWCLTLLGLFVAALIIIYPQTLGADFIVMSALFLVPGLILVYRNRGPHKN